LKNTLKMVMSTKIVALGQNSRCRHCGARLEQWCVGVIYRLRILVSTDVSQPIQKINGIGYLMSVDTINHIFDIGCTISGCPSFPPMQNPNHGKILVCAVRLPMFPALCTATSLDAAPSMPPPSVPLSPPSMSRRPRLRP
jgi:hypothetical protein